MKEESPKKEETEQSDKNTKKPIPISKDFGALLSPKEFKLKRQASIEGFINNNEENQNNKKIDIKKQEYLKEKIYGKKIKAKIREYQDAQLMKDFQELEKEADHNKIFFLWFGGTHNLRKNKNYMNYTQEKMKDFLKTITALLKSTQTTKVCFVIDETIDQSSRADLERLENEFGNRFEIRNIIEEIHKNMRKKEADKSDIEKMFFQKESNVYQLILGALNGRPEMASDILRFFYVLNENKDNLTFYFDVDTWMDYFNQEHLQNGMEYIGYTNWFTIPKTSIITQNDILIGNHLQDHDKQNIAKTYITHIQSFLKEKVNTNNFISLLNRTIKPTFYEEIIDQIIEQYGTKDGLFKNLVIDLTGPGALYNVRALSKGYVDSFSEGSSQWTENHILFMYSIALQITQATKLNYYLPDYVFYYKMNNLEMTEKIKKLIVNLLFSVKNNIEEQVRNFKKNEHLLDDSSYSEKLKNTIREKLKNYNDKATVYLILLINMVPLIEEQTNIDMPWDKNELEKIFQDVKRNIGKIK